MEYHGEGVEYLGEGVGVPDRDDDIASSDDGRFWDCVVMRPCSTRPFRVGTGRRAKSTRSKAGFKVFQI